MGIIPRSTALHISPLFFVISCFVCTSAKPGLLRNDSDSIQLASNDYGNIVHEIPSSVLYPTSVEDIINLIKASNNRKPPFTVAAKGHAHSVRGQAMARGGVVVEMSSLGKHREGIRVYYNSSSGFNYADVGGEQLWIDVLKTTLKHGLGPVSFTDYLYLSVGGTLSNAGISGQTFLHGPQINNVLELDVITGKGEFFTCSKDKNSELFFGVLGGLGQFGIITRARIILDKAPTRAKWVRLIYSNFSTFTSDQEKLISSNAPNYVEGFLISNAETTNKWRSSFSSLSRQSDIVSSLKKNNGLLYSIELVKYYDNQTSKTIDKDFEMLVKGLNFLPGFIFSSDVSLYDFLGRIPDLDSDQKGPKMSHPWLHIFVPKSQISDFNSKVLTTMIPRLNGTEGSLFYPFNRNKFDIDRMSAVIPDEDVFYTLGLLHSSPPNQYQIFDKFNHQLLELSEKAGIKVKLYLPEYKSKQDWMKHFGPKWKTIQQRKTMFDPKMILSPSQNIFNWISVNRIGIQ